MTTGSAEIRYWDSKIIFALLGGAFTIIMLSYFSYEDKLFQGLFAVAVPFVCISVITIILKNPFYGILLFLVMRHLLPIGLGGLIKHTTFQQLIYTYILGLTFISFFMIREKTLPSGYDSLFMKLPLLFKRVLFFLVFAVAVSSLPRILDYDKFFNVNVMSGMSHVNRQVYIYFINGLILAVLVVRLVYSEKRLKQFVWLTIIIGLVLALEGYLQYYGIMTVTPSEIDPTLTGEIRLTAFTGFSAGVTGERMLIPLFFSIAFSSVEKGRRRIFLLIIILIVLPAILLTYTRAVYLALGVGICLYLMLNFGTSAFRKVRKGILGAITVLMTGIGIAIINLGLIDHFQAHGRLSGKLFTGGDSLFVRVIRWILVMDAIKKQPIKGYGLGSSKEVLGMYATGELSNLYSSVHNFYLSWLIDTGIIGLVSLFLLYCYTLKNFNTVRNIAISTGEKDMFIYSNMFIAAFLGTSVVYIVNSDYVFDVFFLLFFALSFVLLRLSLPLKKQAISYSHKKEIIS